MSRTRKQLVEGSVAEKTAKLRASAKEHGLSNADIDCCILAAIKSQSHISPLQCVFWFLKKCFLGMIFTVTFLIIVGLLISYHKPTQQYVTRLAFNSSYHIMRTIRIATLPVTRRFDISRFYYSECIIPNPLYSGEQFSCYPCHNVDKIGVLTDVQDFASTYQNFGIPFIYEDPNAKTVTFEMMKSWYMKHENTFRFARGDSSDSSNPFMHSISELFTKDRTAEDIQQAPFSLQWRVASAGSVRLVRNLCGKPIFIPSESEVQPEMYMVIESSSSHAHRLPKPSMPSNAWLSQAHGSREISLSPVPGCHDNCTEVSVVLRTGDVLFFNSVYWQPSSLPFGDDISISCLGSFH